MAIGVIVLMLFSKQNVEISSLLFGNILLMTETDLIILLLLLGIVFTVLWIPRYKWVFIVQDEEAL